MKEFHYQYKVKVSDLWQFHMYYAYSSFLCVINLVFIVSSFLLLYAFWGKVGTGYRCLLLLYASLFTLIQPAVVWKNCRKRLKKGAPELDLVFDEKGVSILSGGVRDRRKWSQLKQVVFKPTLVTIYVEENEGYILTNRVLGKTRKEFIAFVKAHI